MPTIRVASYLQNRTTIVPIESFEGPIEDPQYIEGALELIVDSQRLITTEMRDYVDQLWTYLVDGLLQASDGVEFSTYFPDQPIRLTMNLTDRNRLRITVESHEVVEATPDYREFVMTVSEAGESFFRTMLSLAPENRNAYLAMLEKLQRLRKRVLD
jgi:hypothetical protein